MINQNTARLSILFTALIILGLATQLPKLQFDYEFEKFFPIEDPDLVFHQDFKKTFGEDNNFILIGIESPNGVFDQEFLTEVDSLTNLIKKTEGTITATSPTQLKKSIKSPLGFVQVPYLHLGNQEKIKKDSIKLMDEAFVRNAYFSDDLASVKLVINHHKFEEKAVTDAYVASIKEHASRFHFKKVRMVGRVIAQQVFIDAIKIDFSRFLVGVIILITLMMILFMRSYRLIAVSLVICLLSVIATISIMVITGKKIDILTSLIPSILLVVSMSDIIHLFTHVRKEINGAQDYSQAVIKAIKEIGWATFLTSVTTAIGFLTLINIRVIPIIDLGKYSAIGIFVAFLITYLLFPAFLILIRPKFPPKKTHRFISRSLAWVINLVFGKKQLIFIVSAGLFGVVIYGITRLEVNDRLIDDIPNGHEVKKSFQYFDAHFGGGKPFTMSVTLEDTTHALYSPEVITEFNTLQTILDSCLNASVLVSPVTYVKVAHQSLKGGNPKYYCLPANDRDWKRTLKLVKKINPDERIRKLADVYQAQITGYSKDLGSKDARVRKKKFQAICDQHINKNLISYEETGTVHLIERSSELLSISLFKGLFIALAIVGIIAGLMFRSIKMVLITLVPNLFPILSVAAVMGYFGIPINMGTSIIFAISFGIVVDDTIHFLSKFKLEKDKGRSTPSAIKRTIRDAGEPIIITTLILTAGFVIFCVSEFSASFYTGLFVSISFVIALIADLFLLPVLILVFMGNERND